MRRRVVFRWLHVVWALPCLVASIVLAGSTEGHPPGLVFLPLALVVWLAGHGVLALAQHLIDRGLERARERGDAAPAPWYVVLTLVASGVASFLALLIFGRLLFDRDAVGLFQLVVLAWMALHLPCFAGVALRRPWGRSYAAGTALAWGLLMLYQIVDHLWRGSPVDAWEWPAAISIVLAFTALAWILFTGAGSRRYFSA